MLSSPVKEFQHSIMIITRRFFRMKRFFSFLTAAAAVCCISAALSAADAKPFRLYKNPSLSPLQFRDSAGRALYFGKYDGHKLVSSPAGTASVDANDLEEVDEVMALTPDFWVEQSKVLQNLGTDLALAPYGYAVSIYIPVHYDFISRHPEEAKSLPQDSFYWSVPRRIWYDRDMNYIRIEGKKPENAAFYRIVCPYGPANRHMAIRPNKQAPPKAAESRKQHPGEIVLNPKADLRERYAATELSRMIGMITETSGVPIVAEPSKDAAFRIHIGPSSDFVKQNFAEDLKALAGKDGFALRKKGNDIAAFGATSRGTIHAMVRLLERNTDFIWFRPDVRYGFSYTKKDVLTFDTADERSVPAFPLRTWGGPGNNDFGNCHRWYTFNYTNLGYHVGNGIFSVWNYRSKELGQFCTIGKNFMTLPFMIEDKPEHYPLVNGVRRYKDRIGQPCFTNPEVVQNSIKALSILLEEIPEELDFFSYDYSDSWVCCECDNCMAPIALPDGNTLKAKSISAQADPWFRSTRTFMMGNMIAEEVNRLRPGLPTQMLAYIYTSANPAVKLNPNLKVLFASYDTGNMRFPLHDQMTRDWYGYAPESWGLRFKKWIEENPASAGIYEYFFTASPAMFADAFAENLRDMVKGNAGWRIYSQSQGDDSNKSIESFGTNAMMWDTNAMDQWIISRLMWDPGQKVEDLRADFLKRVYQNAEPEMTEYYQLFGKKWLDKNCGIFINCHTWASNVYYDFIQKPKIENDLFRLMNQAAEKTTSPAAKTHLERKMTALKTMKEASGRVELPVVDELASDWKDFSSPHWNRAVENSRFHLPLNKDWEKNLSKAQTKIQTACNAEYLFFRITTDSKSKVRPRTKENPGMRTDTVELRFKYGRDRTRSFIICGDGSYADYENWNYTWNSKWNVNIVKQKDGWGAVGRIPIQTVREKPESEVKYLYLRTAPDGEFSFSRSDKNRTLTYPGDHSGTFSPFVFADPSRFLPKMDPAAGEMPGAPKILVLNEDFPVKGGKPYVVRFKAKTSAMYIPDYLRADAARRNGGRLFPQWEFVFKLQNGGEKVIGSQNKNITGTAMEEYTDQFFAPEGAVSVRLRVKQPNGKHKAAATVKDMTVSPLDMDGAVNLNWDFSCGNVFTGWEPIDGAGMREINGKKVMDSGYGFCSARFPLEEGRKYIITGKHKTYAGYNPIEIFYYDKDGKYIRQASYGTEREEYLFRLVTPPGTKYGSLRIYSQYLESCSVKPDTAPDDSSADGQ